MREVKVTRVMRTTAEVARSGGSHRDNTREFEQLVAVRGCTEVVKACANPRYTSFVDAEMRAQETGYEQQYLVFSVVQVNHRGKPTSTIGSARIGLRDLHEARVKRLTVPLCDRVIFGYLQIFQIESPFGNVGDAFVGNRWLTRWTNMDESITQLFEMNVLASRLPSQWLWHRSQLLLPPVHGFVFTFAVQT